MSIRVSPWVFLAAAFFPRASRCFHPICWPRTSTSLRWERSKAPSPEKFGNRDWKPRIIITKLVGASSPQFFSTLTTGEILKNVTSNFVGVNQNGERLLVYPYEQTLTECQIHVAGGTA